MATSSENIGLNPSEGLPSGDRLISFPLTDNVRGLTYGISYTPPASTASILSPNGLIYPTSGMSNGYLTGVSGITDFTAYNDYIHYATGLNPTLITKINVYNSLVRASFRFEMYSRQYR